MNFVLQCAFRHIYFSFLLFFFVLINKKKGAGERGEETVMEYKLLVPSAIILLYHFG